VSVPRRRSSVRSSLRSNRSVKARSPRLRIDPGVQVGASEAPLPTHFESWQLPLLRHRVDRLFRHLQQLSDLRQRENLVRQVAVLRQPLADLARIRQGTMRDDKLDSTSGARDGPVRHRGRRRTFARADRAPGISRTEGSASTAQAAGSGLRVESALPAVAPRRGRFNHQQAPLKSAVP
jgi:hypothetical protein